MIDMTGTCGPDTESETSGDEERSEIVLTSYKIVSTHFPLISSSNFPHSTPFASFPPVETNSNLTWSCGRKRYAARKSR